MVEPYLAGQMNRRMASGLGYIKAKGFRVRRQDYRDAVHRLDPDGCEQRKRKTIVRRVYHSDGPNHMYHLDGNHKLIHYRLVVHGGIDARCSDNNRAATVFDSFIAACKEFMVPAKVRTDRGGENVMVTRFMRLYRGNESVIQGSSVHNQRIERLWSDVKARVLSMYIKLFALLEEDGLLTLSTLVVYLSCTIYLFLV